MPPSRLKPLVIEGPAGAIEAVLDEAQAVGSAATPAGAAAGSAAGVARPAGFAVVCHPHPLHGGTMHNKVAYTLARAFGELGLPTLRFNFRGVGASVGVYDNGRGEVDDALAVVAYGRTCWPRAALSLAGFSFGAIVALRAAVAVATARLVTVAPAVRHLDGNDPVSRPGCPWLIVQGDADEIVDYRQVQAFAEAFTPAPRLLLRPGVDHFFHGRLRELHDAVIAFSTEETR